MTEEEGIGVSPETLMRIASNHLARYSASAAHLKGVLVRRVQRRMTKTGRESLDAAALDAAIDPIIERLKRAGLVDDAVFARGRAAALAAKGRPAWRIKAELTYNFGVDPEVADEAGGLDELDATTQATRWAQRRRLGPFRLRDRAARRERDLASLARAGFSGAVARAVIDGAVPDETGEDPAS